ncbi:MAG TPA: HAD family phosphatase [Segeticoccus sp.]|uniref:HAD family hydrolase n=1 Tax=Segeticoccus sp. TaxID=2706531 RepID=UPI002D7FE5DF|nr:HAD family phosphatase [Segeticoccus sp.]HET8600637.1 HAD family phosphatase [Segeticoccus sp.]
MPIDHSARASDPELAHSAELADPQFAPTPVDAVVFDLGNVLIRWDPQPAIAAAVGDEEARRFLARDGDGTGFDFFAWNHRQDEGRPWAEAEEAAVRAHPGWEAAIRAYRKNFAASLTGAVDDTVQILRELHGAGVPLFALTNWSEELFPVALDRFPFLDLFEDIVVSGEEKVAKPDPRIWEVLEERVRHTGGLEDCIFIDDSPANVQSATAAGLDAILFTDTGHLREDLRARGLPLAPA